MASAPFFIGTAGWSVPKQYADRFAGAGTHLVRYAQVLNAVEINSSFYRPHRRATYARWAASVPAAFRFAVKVPKAMTHGRKLAACGDLIAEFAEGVGGLGDRLGVLLVQLPPKLAYDGAIAHSFFADLHAACAAPIVCEPRHASWFSAEVDAALREWRVARVAADPEPAAGASRPGGWPGLTYVRLHGAPRIYYSAYDAQALAAIRQRLEDRARHGPVWCIFDNTAAYAALGNALSLRGL